MSPDPLRPHPQAVSAAVFGPGTRDRVQARTRALAVLAGRTSLEVSREDYEQAKRELTGATDPREQEAIMGADAPTMAGSGKPPAPGMRPSDEPGKMAHGPELPGRGRSARQVATKTTHQVDDQAHQQDQAEAAAPDDRTAEIKPATAEEEKQDEDHEEDVHDTG